MKDPVSGMGNPRLVGGGSKRPQNNKGNCYCPWMPSKEEGKMLLLKRQFTPNAGLGRINLDLNWKASH